MCFVLRIILQEFLSLLHIHDLELFLLFSATLKFIEMNCVCVCSVCSVFCVFFGFRIISHSWARVRRAQS